jgi:hypothetical protein
MLGVGITSTIGIMAGMIGSSLVNWGMRKGMDAIVDTQGHTTMARAKAYEALPAVQSGEDMVRNMERQFANRHANPFAQGENPFLFNLRTP